MTVRDYLRKFVLVNWKHHKQQFANPLQLAILTLSAPLFTLFAVILRLTILVDHRSDNIYDPIDLDRSWLEMVEALNIGSQVNRSKDYEYTPFSPQMVIGWAPEKFNIFEHVMKHSQRKFGSMEIKPYADCDTLTRTMEREHLFAGICYDSSHFEPDYRFEDGILSNEMSIKPVLNYSIIFPSELRQTKGNLWTANWMTVYQDDPRTYILKRLNQPYTGGYVGYVREGFIRLQKSISESFLTVISQKSLPKVVLRRFPVIGKKQDTLMYYLEYGMSALLIAGYLFPAQVLVWQMVTEKESQLRLFLINMNIGNIIHYICWYIKGVIYNFVGTAIVVVLLKVHWTHDYAVLTQTPWYILTLILCTYNMSTTAMVMMIASFFQDALSAVRVMTIIWVATYLPCFVLWNNPEVQVLPLRYLSYIMPNAILMLSFESIMEREMLYQKNWYDASYELKNDYGPVSVRDSTLAFITNGFLFAVIGMYMDTWRNTDRTAKSMKRPARATLPDDPYQDNRDSFSHQGQAIGVNSTKIYEVEPSHRRFKLKIKKLCKKFGSSDRAALNMFTWNVYENEVTVLMGHNGSGKTTLLKILAGLTEPSRGTVMISNYNIQTERKAASMELGIAFDTDMLLHSLTVLDNLRFICRVKGMHNSSEIENQVEFYVATLQLEPLRNKRLRNLTPRDLCLVAICCAFVGRSAIILIDDIHSDLDRATQSLVWGLINEEKSRRTIILVSNSPTLAENLADRMAIMSNGELKCTGTKPFLKNMYGHGYRLTCVKGRRCNVDELYALMSKYMPNLSVETNIGFKVTYVLENKYEDQFPLLIDDLEESMERLDVVSFRIRDTSMEEIFLRFGCEETDPMGGVQSLDNPNALVDEYYEALRDAEENGKIVGWRLTVLRMAALLSKRWIFTKRHWIIILAEGLFILVGFLSTFAGTFIYSKHFELVPVTFNLSQLPVIDAFAEVFSDDTSVVDMHAYYMELLYWYDAHVSTINGKDEGKYALLKSNDFAANVNYKFMFGATFDRNLVTAWFNNIPLHTAPFALNLVHNAVARHFFDEEATIDVTLILLPFQTRINNFPPGSHSVGSVFAVTLCWMLIVTWPAMCVFLIKERCSTVKKQQFLAGASFGAYWANTLLYDILAVFSYTFVIMAVVGYYLNPIHNYSFYFFLWFVVVLHSLWVILFTYLVSEFCQNPFYGYMIICLVSSFGNVGFTVLYRHDVREQSKPMYIFAMYVASEIISYLFEYTEYHIVCADPMVEFTSKEVFKCNSEPNCCHDKTYMARYTNLLQLYLVLILHVMLVGGGLFIYEVYTVMGFGYFRKAPTEEQRKAGVERTARLIHATPFAMQDMETQTPRRHSRRTRSKAKKEHAAVAAGIYASYRKKKVLENLDFYLEKTECISLTGPNNSGKSTLLRVMVCEKRISAGAIWITSYSMEKQRQHCYRLIGYCPQTATLPSEFTPRNLLRIFAMLQGYHPKTANALSDALLRMLSLTPCWNRSIKCCTSGQSRRLLFALAILGKPKVVLVDGVPGGMDPTGKRTVFTITSKMQETGASFLYTHLGALDAERLCQRTPVMMNGQLMMVGSFDDVNENYSSGYQLEVRFKRKVNPNVSMSRTTWNRINHFPMSPHKKFSAFMEIKFPDAALRREREDSMVFTIPLACTTFSDIFLILRKDAFEMNIEDYFITRNIRMGLEVFLYDSEKRQQSVNAYGV
ncbi:hypothetical protein KR018_002037 [Drosophila ironensis]|nr:hypothetical protein KR018_002037 [Drosophila ironensis]